MRAHVFICLIAVLASCFAGPSNAWDPEGAEVGVLPGGDYLNYAPGNVAPDGAGGVYVVWSSTATGLDDDGEIRMQRLDADGDPIWAPGGIVLAAAGAGRLVYSPQVAADGTGGAVVTYVDNRDTGTPVDFDLYVERIDGAGTRLWGAGGVRLTGSAVMMLESPRVVGTGNGGALVAWIGTGAGFNPVLAQKFDPSGVALGPPTFIDVFSMQDASDLEIATNGSTYAVISATTHDFDSNVWFAIFELAGPSAWPVVMDLIVMGSSEETGAKCVIDAYGGLYVSFFTDINGYRELWVQGFNGVWAAGPISTTGLVDPQYYSSIALEPTSGDVMVAWTDNRTNQGGTDFDIYAQRFRPDGSPVWRADGVAVTEVTGQQQEPHIIDDGEGGAIVLWDDDRDPDGNVYAQRLAPGGRELWNAQGVPVFARSGNQQLTRPVWAASGELRLGFQDLYTGSESRDVRLQRLDPVHGWWGRPSAVLTSLADVPGDQGGALSLSWAPSDHDRVGMYAITHYSVWRSTLAIPRGIGPDSPVLVDAAEVGFGFEGPAFRFDAATGYYWEYVGQQEAASLPGYAYTVPTTANGLSHAVQVLAHTGDYYVSFASNSLEATSTDDLAPAAPLALNAWRTGSDDIALEWLPGREDEPDFSRFEVYRCEGSVFSLGAATLITSAIEPTAIDVGAGPTSGFVYAIVAVDVHENASEPSEPFVVPPATGIGDEASLTKLMLRPCSPNPFSGSTLLLFRLPRAGEVEVTLYDLKGRAVRTLHREASAGWQELPLDDRDDNGSPLASGVYFLRVRAGDQRVQQKIAIMR